MRKRPQSDFRLCYNGFKMIDKEGMNLGMATDTLEFKKSTSEIKEAIQSIGAKL